MKKAQAYVWLVVLFTLFAMALLYIVLNEGMENIKSNVGGNFTGSRYETTYKKVNTLWDLWPLIGFVLILVWGITTAMRKTQYV